MLNKIKSYWYELKTEYENRDNKPVLKDFTIKARGLCNNEFG